HPSCFSQAFVAVSAVCGGPARVVRSGIRIVVAAVADHVFRQHPDHRRDQRRPPGDDGRSTVAEITSQYATVSSTDVSNILAAASTVLTPFPVANAKVTLSSVLIDANGNATVDWSATLNGTQRSGTVTSSIPAALLVPNTSVIWGEASYSYKPAIGWVI